MRRRTFKETSEVWSKLLEIDRDNLRRASHDQWALSRISCYSSWRRIRIAQKLRQL